MLDYELKNLKIELNRAQPATLQDFIDLGFKLKYISNGAFRSVHKIKGYDAVIKSFDSSDESHSLRHAEAEYKTVNKILTNKKYKILKPFMPNILYFNQQTGLTVMQFYKNIPANSSTHFISELVNYIIKISGWRIPWDGTDAWGNNFGYDPINNQIVIRDLGYFLPMGH